MMNITAFFGSMAFLNPWVLAGLIFLPALWFLLRVTPPAPRLIIFPPARFIAGLEPDEPTTSRTPWWILLLRLLTLALIIFALAQPVLNPSKSLPGSGPVRIIMDNSWAAAQSWQMQSEEAQNLISSAGRDKREIFILTTAPEPGEDAPSYHGPMTQGQAESILRGLKPYPWPADYNTAAKLVLDNPFDGTIASYWLSHGLREGDNQLAEALQNQGRLRYIKPEDAQLPMLLRPVNKITSELAVLVSAPQELPAGTPAIINAIGPDGRVLDSQKIALDVSDKSAEVVFEIPDSLRNQVQQIRLAGQKGAGSILLLDDQFKRRDIAIVSSAASTEEAPLIEESFYLDRALQPYANVTIAPLADVLETSPSVIILPNIGAMGPELMNRLEKWVREGGLLLRFAGPNMTQSDNFLVPVPLLKGGRALDGALTWDKPVKLAPFTKTSPLYGLALPEEVTVRRQILAEPIAGLDDKTWAALEDGTPLITADSLGNGMTVLVHTTATPLWSDFALSGLFVQILRRVVGMAGSNNPQTAATGLLQPLLVLDGFGAISQPGGFAEPLQSEYLDTVVPGPRHPPGLYGRAGHQRSLNLGERLGALKTFTSLPAGVETALYGKQNERDLMPLILIAAFGLFLLDWLLMAMLQFSWRRFRHAPAMVALIACLFSYPSFAQSEAEMAAYAGDMHLAYVRSGNAAVDSAAHQGLEALGEVLKQRTSVEPAGVVAINPAEDELAFFPFIYWPVTQEQPELSGPALKNIQYYIDHGGTILFDTRDHNSSVNNVYGQNGGRNALKLRNLVGNLNIPPLVPIAEDHVLTKSFYLLDSFPGRYEGGALWVEEQSTSGRDGVSSVIIGGNDWAGAWAASKSTSGVRVSGGPQQEEMALRFGVNLVMYALTGNYKSDQVHLPHILERLGQ